MKHIVLIITLFLLISCEEKTDLNALILLDEQLRTARGIEQFGDQSINNLHNENHLNLDRITPNLSMYLESINVSNQAYDSIRTQMKALRILDYFRMDNYSVYFTYHSFANRHGLLINHSCGPIGKKKIWVAGRFDVNVGEEIENSIHPFWTD